MRDLDDLLRSDVAGHAARAARPADFADVAGRGRRRRTRRHALLASAAVVVVVGATALADLGPQRTTAPDPAVPTPTSVPSRTAQGELTPEQVVDDPRAQVRSVVVAPGDPDVRAVTWSLCPDQQCRRPEVAVALTDDGFATRTVTELEQATRLEPGGDTAFIGNDPKGPYVLLLDGAKIGLEPPRRQVPVQPGEVVSSWSGWGFDGAYAVDPGNGRTHRIPAPSGLVQLQGSADGRLDGLARSGSGPADLFVWSDDGGSTWSQHSLPSDETPVFSLVPSAATGTRAVLGAGGATLLPFDDVVRSTAAGSWERFSPLLGPQAYAGDSVVLPDGRLVVDLVGDADAGAGQPVSRPRGPYVSDVDDWAVYERLLPAEDSGLPDDEQAALADGELALVGVSATAGDATLYVMVLGGSGAGYAVTDSGRTWTPVELR